MPITLPPISRRRFVAGSLAAGAGLLAGLSPFASGEEANSDPHRFALISDTHVAADKATVHSGTTMFANLTKVCGEVAKLSPRPSAVIVNGDCAYQTGESGDYATFLEPIKTMREAGLPIHLTLGNHDNRERFWHAIPPDHGEDKPVEHRHVAIIESQRANWFILDSLVETNHTPGELGPAQLGWLASALDARAEKPALVMVHHNPDSDSAIPGLLDTKALFDLLQPRKQVKAWFYGHTHDWHHSNHDGLHLVNFPPVAYVFTPGRPSGWVDAQLETAGATLQLHTLDPSHPQAREKITLNWR
jgi:Icc protein